MRKTVASYLLFTCIAILNVVAQEHTHRFYTVYDGLPQSQITCMAQDCTGYIWVGTKGGVARFDGHNFEAFTTKNGLLANIMYKILPTDSCIWFFSHKGITCFSNNTFAAFKVDSLNVTLAGFVKRKMLFYNEKCNQQFEHNQFIPARLPEIFPKSMLIAQIEFLPYDSSYIVRTSPYGLYWIKESKMICIDSLASDFEIIDSKKGELVYWSNSEFTKKMLKYQVKDKKSSLFQLPGLIPDIFMAVKITNGHQVAYNKNQVALLNGKNIYFIQKKFNYVTNVLIDNQHNIWVADEDGLYRFNKLEFVEFTKQNSNVPPYVWDIKEYPTGKLWFASFGSGLWQFKNNTFIEDSSYKLVKWLHNQPFYFNSPDHGNKLIFNLSGGVITFDGKNFSRLLPDIHKPFAALCTFHDTINHRYFSSGGGEDLYVGNGTDNTTQYKGSDTTFRRNILDICYDKDNEICIGHRGLSKFKNGRFTPYPNMPDTLTWRVFSLKKDHHGNLWIGTDQGLWFYNYDTVYQINTEYFKNYVTFLELLDTTWLMGGTTLGLPLLYLPDFYKNGTQNVKYYDRYNGFTGRDCAQNGTLHDSENTYWIPTVDRVLRLDPTKIAFNTIPPKLIFNGISLMGNNLSWHVMGDTVTQFHHSQNSFKFSFTGLNYAAPERVKYRYRLTGYNPNWSEPRFDREAIFTNLKAGKYIFEILACNEDGYWTPEPVSFSFHIKPAWWQVIWVKLAIMTLLLGILTLSIIYITKKRSALQREKLETRNRMLNMSLSTIKNQMDPHFTFNALNGIESLIMKEDRATAYQYLLKLSALIRNTLNDNDLINRTLADEIDFVQAYLELEKFRFKDKFDYHFKVAPEVDLQLTIPKLILQIFIENAIKHGLMHKEKGGILTIDLNRKPNQHVFTITDNGIGREKAKQYAIHSTGKGLGIIRKLILHFNEQHKSNLSFTITDLHNPDGTPSGTKVEIIIA